MKNFSKSGGFTLIELLVVIAIIGILTSILMVNLNASKAKARDAQRVSDIGQMQLALELYYDRCKQYPTPNTSLVSGHSVIDSSMLNTACPNNSSVTLSNYIAKIPTPPVGAPNQTYNYYDYVTNSGNTDYVLHTYLEYTSSASPDSLSSNPYSGFSCDNSLNYCAGPK